MDINAQRSTLNAPRRDSTLRRQLAQKYPLVERPFAIGGRAWRITAVQDQDALMDSVQSDADLEHFPYGLLLWPSAVALAEHLAEESSLVEGRRVLEIGSGAGLPGLMAKSMGAEVTQTDHQTDALALGQWNALQNGVEGVASLCADWRLFPDNASYEVILGSDVLYERSLHHDLRRLFRQNLAPGGCVMLSDPLRPQAFEFADLLERDGWRLRLESRSVAWEGETKEIAIYFVGR